MKPDPSPRSPWVRAVGQGVDAARRNLPSMSVLLGLMAVIVALYYFCPPGAALLTAYGAWQHAGGTLRTGLIAGIAGGILSELSLVYLRDRGRWNLTHLENMAFRFVLFFISGMIVNEFYRLQAHLFGNEPSWRVILPKVIVDQFVYSVIVSTPQYSLAFRWQNLGYSGAKLRRELDSSFVIERMLPILVTNWMFWIPGVTLVYSMPLPLQMPLNIFATAVWGILISAVARQESFAPASDVPVPGLPDLAAPSSE